jgi:hypothetical protein
VEHVIAKYGVSERLACRVLGQHRSTQRKIPKQSDDEAALTADIIALATQYGRYGYRRITALLRDAGWLVNTKRVERIWRRDWLKDRSCIRLRPEYPNIVLCRHNRSHAGLEVPDGKARHVVQAVDLLEGEALHEAVGQHGERDLAPFLRGLEDEAHGAVEATFLGEQLGGSSSMAVWPSWPQACIVPGHCER